jgi:hypothetical protein
MAVREAAAVPGYTNTPDKARRSLPEISMNVEWQETYIPEPWQDFSSQGMGADVILTNNVPNKAQLTTSGLGMSTSSTGITSTRRQTTSSGPLRISDLLPYLKPGLPWGL